MPISTARSNLFFWDGVRGFLFEVGFVFISTLKSYISNVGLLLKSRISIGAIAYRTYALNS